MSAYSASAPVIARNTDPSVSSDPNRCAAKNAYACHGFSADRMPGFFRIGGSPRIAMMQEPRDHDRAEHHADAARASTLHEEQPDQNRHRNRHDVGLEHVGRHAEALDRAQHRDGRRDHAVAVEQRRAEQADRDEDPAVRFPRAPADQRDQREDAAFTLVVGTHHEQHVFDRHRDDQRPDDERQHAVHVADRHRNRVHAVEALAQRVQRARADVAEDDAESREDQNPRARGTLRGHCLLVSYKSRPDACVTIEPPRAVIGSGLVPTCRVGRACLCSLLPLHRFRLG